MSKTGLTIDTTNFNRAVAEMARLSGVKFEDVVKAEIGSILSQTITNTPKASKASIEKSLNKWIWTDAHSPARHPQSSLRKGTSYLVGPGAQGSHRYSAEIWNFIQENKAKQQAELIKRIGLTKKSWYLIAKSLGITLPKKVPGYVLNATTHGKERDDLVDHERKVSGSKVGFKIINNTLSAVRGGGRAALLKAINGRTGYFYRNLRAGSFKKVAEIAKKYPGFKIRGI